MPRTAVTPTPFEYRAKVARPVGTTIDAALVTTGVVISGVPLEELLVEVTQAAVAAKVVTIQPGDNPPAQLAGQGGYTGSQAQDEVAYYGPFESARFVHVGDEPGLWVDFEVGTVGTIRAYRVPRA